MKAKEERRNSKQNKVENSEEAPNKVGEWDQDKALQHVQI
jgi:hypothetical protein